MARGSGGSKSKTTAWERELINSTPLTEMDLSQVQPIFDFFDTDQDGLLTPKQCTLLFAQLGFPDVSMAVTLTDYPAFCRLLGLVLKRAYEKGDLEGQLSLVFRLMDYDRTGNQNGHDLKRYLGSIGVKTSEEAADRVAELIYSEGMASFNEAEFIEFIKGEKEAAERKAAGGV